MMDRIRRGHVVFALNSVGVFDATDVPTECTFVMLKVLRQPVNVYVHIKFVLTFHIVVVLIRDVAVSRVPGKVVAESITLFLLGVFVI